MILRCDLTDLPVDGCAHCRPAPPDPGPTVTATTEARFTGRCPGGCGGWIDEGDEIFEVDGLWVCPQCAP